MERCVTDEPMNEKMPHFPSQPIACRFGITHHLANLLFSAWLIALELFVR